MNNVVLIFPDTEALAGYLLRHRPSNVEVNSLDCLLTAVLSHDEVAMACSNYGAAICTDMPVLPAPKANTTITTR